MILDSREHALIELAPLETVKTLDVGDIWIGLSGEELVAGGILVERKTVTDFEASFMDKRYREQRTRLTAFCQEKGAKPVYIIEGSIDSGRTLEKTAIWKLLFRLGIRYGISVIRTASLEETLEVLQTLEAQWKNDPDTFKTPNHFSYVEAVGSVKKESGDNPRIFAIQCLTACRGISVKIAEALLDKFGGFQGVMTATSDDMSLVKSGTRAIGLVVARRLWCLLRG